MGSRELRAAIRRLVRPNTKVAFEVQQDLPVEALVKLRLEGLEKQVDELKWRVNGLLLTIVGTLIAELTLRITS